MSASDGAEWKFVLALGLIPFVSIAVGTGFSLWSWLEAWHVVVTP
jgi:hypothetical protein